MIVLLLSLGAAIALAVSMSGVATADEISLRVTLNNQQCTQNANGSLTCTGSLTGLGGQSISVTVTSGFACLNRGGNQPPGQVSGTENNIPVRNGNATFNVTTSAASCPDQMQPLFTGTEQCGAGNAQVDVTQFFSGGRTKTTTFCVPIT
ncbi:MAG TPA: hypothetical protein VE596_15585 [Gaiellaceae bacterium]|nr:hypothetical protein [Gaiellaceae bacterium]